MNRWTVERAQEWYSKQPWLVGCNFLPSSAINQIEMWSAETWDPETIDRELGWAAGLGFNSVRVYLHDLVWHADAEGFASRIDDFLGIGAKHGINALLVLFDDCHRPDPELGAQPLPVRGFHNSGWKHSPGQALVREFHEGTAPESERARLRDYVRGVLTRFAGDERILMWDVYNEPGQSDNGDVANELLDLAWQWAREVDIAQPLTACLDGSCGEKNIAMNAERSDVISFHCYVGDELESVIAGHIEAHAGRPLVCTEYMARELGTTFQHSLPLFKRGGIACYNWGLVAGKSQTHFSWKSRGNLEERVAAGDFVQPGEPFPEPELWFHDIVRVDGSPFDPAEVEFIRQITGVNA